MESTGKLLLALALVLSVAGGAFLLLGKAGVGRLPGDMSFGKGNWRVFFPLGTSILISIILSVLLNVFFRSR